MIFFNVVPFFIQLYGMKINKEWHVAHPMPKNPTLEQRVGWHVEHAKNCNCRDIPPKIKMEIKKRNIKLTGKKSA